MVSLAELLAVPKSWMGSCTFVYFVVCIVAGCVSFGETLGRRQVLRKPAVYQPQYGVRLAPSGIYHRWDRTPEEAARLDVDDRFEELGRVEPKSLIILRRDPPSLGNRGLLARKMVKSNSAIKTVETIGPKKHLVSASRLPYSDARIKEMNERSKQIYRAMDMQKMVVSHVVSTTGSSSRMSVKTSSGGSSESSPRGSPRRKSGSSSRSSRSSHDNDRPWIICGCGCGRC